MTIIVGYEKYLWDNLCEDCKIYMTLKGKEAWDFKLCKKCDEMTGNY